MCTMGMEVKIFLRSCKRLDVWLVSTPFIRGTHEPPAQNMVNIPMRVGSGAEKMRQVVHEHWLPRLYSFAPELLFFSAGFDAHDADDMAQLAFHEADFQWITEQVMRSCAHSTHGRVLSMLEGGYDCPSLARSVEAHVRALSVYT